MPPSTNPMEHTYSKENSNGSSTSKSIPHPPPISSVTHMISGIKTITYGLDELPKTCIEVTVLWLLHPRLQTQAVMAPFASQFINAWNSRRKHDGSERGFIAISFDQRNHGTRQVSAIHNEAWRSGNERHAQDMFSCYHGTSVDTSQLLDFLPAYIFPTGHPATDQPIEISQNIVLGVSLGGHAAWHVVMQDARFNSAIVTIGTSDYTRLMSDRARLSKRKTWLDGKGRDFVGNADFPKGLVEAVKKYDPAGLMWGSGLAGRRQGQEHLYEDLTQDEKASLLPLMTRTLGNKRILNLSGGSDKLVPYAMGKPFLDWLKKSVAPGGFFEGGGLYFEDIVIPGAGHEVPPKMVEHMEKFLMETLESEDTMRDGRRTRRGSKM